MSFIANVLTVLIASPGDVADERDLATEEMHRWNAANATSRQLILSPVRWETHSSPQMGAHPQALLNEQILTGVDIVAGIFGTRIGTATPGYLSGSVEEIKRHVAAGKLAMIYFSRVPVDPNTINHDQWAALQQFKEECRTGGLYHEYETKEQFKQDFGHHLSLELNKPKYLWMQRPQTPDQQDVADVMLSELERELLLAMSEDTNGYALHGSTMESYFVQINGKSFGDGSARKTAALKRALQRLEELGYTSERSDEVYELTDEGFERADAEASAHVSIAEEPTLSAKALELLKAGIAGQGNIMHRSFIGGENIYAGNQTFMTGRDPRGDAEWREALDELLAKSLLDARSDSLNVVTAAGYRVAEELTVRQTASDANSASAAVQAADDE